MLILGLDFETTGFDFAKDRIIEIGAVLWDTEHRVPMEMMSALIHWPDNELLTPEITAITGITDEMLAVHGVDFLSSWAEMHDLMRNAEAIVAHNGTGFDKPMYEAHCGRWSLTPAELPWIDTCIDVPYPPAITTRKLVHLAAEHGFLNPFAHRAVFDVLTMLRVLDQYDIAEVLESAKQPSLMVRAIVSYDDREKAKARGYRWDAGTKTWRKPLKAHRLEEERLAMEAERMGLEVIDPA